MIYQNQIPYNPHQVLLGKQKKKFTKRERHTYCNNLKYITIFLPCIDHKGKRKTWNTKIKYIIILSKKKKKHGKHYFAIRMPNEGHRQDYPKKSEMIFCVRIGWNWKIHTTNPAINQLRNLLELLKSDSLLPFFFLDTWNIKIKHSNRFHAIK